MTIEVTILLSVIAVCLSAIFGYAIFRRNAKTDDKAEASQMTTVIVSLESIKDGIKEIKLDMSNVKDEVREQRDNQIRIEESLKSAWKRIEILEERKGKVNV
jgi:peptidoglycan hydrolase CwlO-like protein